MSNPSKLNEANGTRRPVQVKDAVYSKFFRDLTSSFMHPLERYLFTLMPLLKNISPFKKPPGLRKFNAQEFLATIEGKGPQLTSPVKGNWVALYSRFIRSPNFHAWLEKRATDMKNRISKLHFVSITNINPGNLEWLEKSVVEQVDQILKFKKVLRSLHESLALNRRGGNFSFDRLDEVGNRFLKVVHLEHEQDDLVAKMTAVVESLITNLPEDTKDLVRGAKV